MTALGCIADDYTGATDVAAALRGAGMRVVLLFGLPSRTEIPLCDAVVVGLKTRTSPVREAIRQSVMVREWLKQRGVDQLYFKYCSTFDSTGDGNIGPVADALLDAEHQVMTLVCPASPEHGRTIYCGHLFVGESLLSESSMRYHPLTPMRDSNLVRVLSHQTPHPVALLPLDVIRSGLGAVKARLISLEKQGVRHVVVDATEEADLRTVATAARGMSLLTGAAGLARALAVVKSRALTARNHEPVDIPRGSGIILAGSCSATTLSQVAFAKRSLPSYRLDPVATPDGEKMKGAALAWLQLNWKDGPLMVYSSAGPEERREARTAMGPQTADILEDALGSVAEAAVRLGARRVVVAGGETAGAVVSRLGIDMVSIASEEDAGVPWCVTTDQTPLALLLKSGNFGTDDLLVRAAKAAGR